MTYSTNNNFLLKTKQHNMNDWINCNEQTPEIGQMIEVHTFSDLYLESVYSPHLDLEGICDKWRPIID